MKMHQDATMYASILEFGQTVTPGSTGDINGDGAVNTSDLTALLARFGQFCK